MENLHVLGIPETIDEADAGVFRSRLLRAVEQFRSETGVEQLDIRLATGARLFPKTAAIRPDDNDASLEERAVQYVPSEPLWGMEQLVIPDDLREELRTAVEMVRLEPLVFDAWGLRRIEPFPRSALNFHGPPGTGKTLAAHAVAKDLGKGIIAASYAQIESKYVGEGPKNVEAIFRAAQQHDALLFIDEADSLLSRRLTTITHGSDQAINSMRSQILICLERYRGVVIFATNLVENYDPAFETRVRHICFPLPDDKAREAIWRTLLPAELPLDGDVAAADLAVESHGFCGREIKNAVLDAACRAAMKGKERIGRDDFRAAISRIDKARQGVRSGKGGLPFMPVEERQTHEAGLIAELPPAFAVPDVAD